MEFSKKMTRHGWLRQEGQPVAVRVELLSIPLHSSSRVVLQRYVESAGKKGSSVD